MTKRTAAIVTAAVAAGVGLVGVAAVVVDHAVDDLSTQVNQTVQYVRKNSSNALTGCYGGSEVQRLSTDITYHQDETGKQYWQSYPIFVTEGSPCRDINLRGSWNTATRRSECVQYRVRWVDGSRREAPWTTVCGGWRVVYPNAQEGDVFVIESTTPASVVVRS
jgi:hypothetical protein